MALFKKLKSFIHWGVSKDFGKSKTKHKAFNSIVDNIEKPIFSPEDIERAYNNQLNRVRNDGFSMTDIPREDGIDATGDYLETIEHMNQALRDQGYSPNGIITEQLRNLAVNIVNRMVIRDRRILGETREVIYDHYITEQQQLQNERIQSERESQDYQAEMMQNPHQPNENRVLNSPIVRDGSYEYGYELPQLITASVYQARQGDLIFLYKALNMRLEKGSFVIQNESGEIEGTINSEEAIGITKDPSLITGDSNHSIVQVKILKDVTIFLKYKTHLRKPKPKPKEFKVSDLITLRLEPTNKWIRNSYETRPKTQIYVKGKRFRQCKFLLLNLEVGNNYEEIESIDQAKELLEVKEEDLIDLNTLTDTMDDLKPNYDGQLERSFGAKISIPPETEFWGHCSNIQAWYKYNYDLRILHSNLSLPLLKELAQHDGKAKLRLKEQIAEKVEKGGYKAWEIYKNTIYKYFTIEERILLEEFRKF